MLNPKMPEDKLYSCRFPPKSKIKDGRQKYYFLHCTTSYSPIFTILVSKHMVLDSTSLRIHKLADLSKQIQDGRQINIF